MSLANSIELKMQLHLFPMISQHRFCFLPTFYPPEAKQALPSLMQDAANVNQPLSTFSHSSNAIIEKNQQLMLTFPRDTEEKKFQSATVS